MASLTSARPWMLALAISVVLFGAALPAGAAGVTLYVVTNYDSNLRTVDPLSGAILSSVPMTLPGRTVFSATGMARHPISGDLYVLLKVENQSTRELAIVDPATGLGTDLGPADDGSATLLFADIAFASDGTLYGVTGDGSAQPETLFTLNPGTGLATFVTHLGNGDSGEAIAFDPGNGLLYHASGYSSAIFETVNPAAPSDPPVNVPIPHRDYFEATSLAHWFGNTFLWANFSSLFVVTADGRIGYLSYIYEYDPSLGDYVYPTVTGMAFTGPTSSPSCPQTLYGATDYFGSHVPDLFFSIDPATGAARLIGPIGFQGISAMDFSSDGILYALGERMDGSNTAVLLTIDLCTGAGTEVGATSAALTTDMSFRSTDGALFATTQTDLYRIDRTTGAATLIGPTGAPRNGSALAFNLAGDVLYYAPELQLFSLDPATAAPTLLNSLNIDGALNALDADPQSGTLYASFYDYTTGNHLATLDPASGTVTVIGPTQQALDSLAFRSGTPGTNFDLTLNLSGTGNGTVTSSPPGISCPGVCSASFPSGTSVTLNALPAGSNIFAGWSGACTGTGTCTVSMNAPRTVTAVFSHLPSTLFLGFGGTGHGSVGDPDGIWACASNCDKQFPWNSLVTLQGQPVVGSYFVGWFGGSGDCSGTGDCILTMDSDKVVNAYFDLLPVFPLTVTRTGSGSGTVTSAPAGVNCGLTCVASYSSDLVVALTPTPAPGSAFTGWSGDCSGTGACQVAMTAARNVTATFDLVPTFALTVSRAGSGSGSVSSNPAGIDCGATCSASYTQGTGVTLTASPAAGSVFTGWSGPCAGTGACQVTMNAAAAVTATFDLAPPPDFSFASPPPPQETSAGQPAHFTITIGGNNGFNGSVSFTCASGLPSLSSCSFSPPSVMAGANPVSTTLTINTTPSTLAGLRTPRSDPYLFATALPVLGLVFLGAAAGRSGRRRVAGILLLLVLVIPLAMVLGCGGTGGIVTAKGHPGTPPGNYSVTVTATAGNLSHSEVVHLAVH